MASLTRDEINAFLKSAPQIAADIQTHEKAPGLYSLEGNLATGDGRAVRAFQWGDRFVLVQIDAAMRLHFDYVTQAQAVQFNKPVYVSPTYLPGEGVLSTAKDYWFGDVPTPGSVGEAIRNAAHKAEEAVNNLFDGLLGIEKDLRNLLIIALVLAAVVLSIAAYKGIEVPGARIG